jgi:hypothetical protein
MAEIEVARAGPERFAVTVTDGGETTTHDVTVPPSLMGDRLKLKWVDCERVVRESFVFLLEREPPTSIMRSFSLEQIPHYFPEYYEEMHRRLAGDEG